MKESTASTWEMDASTQPVFLVTLEHEYALFSGTAPISAPCSSKEMLQAFGFRRPLVVSGRHFDSYSMSRVVRDSFPEAAFFSDYSPNPTIEEVQSGIARFKENRCDSLISVGGGSAIDTAKCIQAFQGLPSVPSPKDYLSLPIPEEVVAHVAMPTTAGTGSESTHFAVVYSGGVKHSVASHKLLPTAAVLDSSALGSLPDYHKRATAMDALCQAIESYWSVRSTETSRAYSREAIPRIIRSLDSYLAGNVKEAEEMMISANYAGKAINITTTTAPHAMSYKLTSLYDIAHGHAVSLCLPECWDLLSERGSEETKQRLQELAELLGHASPSAAVAGIRLLCDSLFDEEPVASSADLELLAESVNLQRLGNFPVSVSKTDLVTMYRAVLKC